MLHIALLAACHHHDVDTSDTTSSGSPDPSFVYEPSSYPYTVDDVPFVEEQPTFWRTTDVLGDLDVRAIAVSGAFAWAGTSSGLYRTTSSADGATPWSLVTSGAVADVAPLSDGRVAVAIGDAVDVVAADGSVTSWSLPGARAVATWGTTVYAADAGEVYRLDDAPVALFAASAVDLAVTGGHVWAATSSGLLEDGVPVDVAKLPDADVRGVSALPSGGVLVAASTGAALVGTSADVVYRPGISGLPNGDLTAAAASADEWLLGSSDGMTVLRPTDAGEDVALPHAAVDWRHGERWLPSDDVRAVAVDEDGTRWIATSGGVARISLVTTTLAEKAARMEVLVPRFWRLDFVADEGDLADPWQPDADLFRGDFDNDGLWTQAQIGAWAHAAAATGDPAYCELAKRAIGMMDLEQDVPAGDFAAAGVEAGFVARSLVRDDEGALFDVKADDPRWHRTTWGGHDWYWKDDTSSDETTGHFFGWPLYYDLCAGDAEKADVAEHLGALAGTIVDHDFTLVDVDGEPTTYGHWEPDVVSSGLDPDCVDSHTLDDCLGSLYGAGWLQSIEILGHLLAAWHVTGDERFYEAYLHLLDDEGYGDVAMLVDDAVQVNNPAHANHSDHELAMLAYATLIRYEPDDDRRARWLESLETLYGYERGERNPLWAAIVAGAGGQDYAADDLAETLREIPEDRREWRMENSARQDYVLEGDDRFDEPQFTEVPPYDEIRTFKWNGNPYTADAGGDGRGVQGPWPWLLPYWMARHEGVLR